MLFCLLWIRPKVKEKNLQNTTFFRSYLIVCKIDLIVSFYVYFCECFFSSPFSDEGTSKTFTCARPLVGQFVAIQLVGVEGSLSLCEVEVFSNDGKQS